MIGALQTVAGGYLTHRFARRCAGTYEPHAPVTILKPLHGDEPLLTQALGSLCLQDYPPGYQIVFGVAEASDAALTAVRVLGARFPNQDMTLVIDATRHGTNPKVGNLMNMLPAAKHDILVIADSDVHAPPDYLRRLAEAGERPGVGLVTVLYQGRPWVRGLASSLGATQIIHGFLPAALLARSLGRRDCLGATMCLRRDMLARIGGFDRLKDHLADDNVLGRLVRAQGFEVVLAETVVATTVPETTLPSLWRHELRWARTIRTLEPAGFAASVLQYPLFWAGLALIAASGAVWVWALLILVWTIRASAAKWIDRSLAHVSGGLAFRCPVWLLPFRDVLSAAVWAAAHAGRQVEWRGQTMEADTPPRFTKGSHAR